MFEIMPFDRRSYRMRPFDPFREMQEMQRAFWNTPAVANGFRTDISETNDAYKLEAELPGFKKEDIKIDIENDCLTISAERKAETKDEKENYVKRERVYGSFTRCFDVSGINVDGIEASYADGMLNVTLPKKAAEVPASRRLEIK